MQVLEQLQQRAPASRYSRVVGRGRGQLFGLDSIAAIESRDMRLSAAKFCYGSSHSGTDTANDDKSNQMCTQRSHKAVDCEAEEEPGLG
jgi:hypothetical protein